MTTLTLDEFCMDAADVVENITSGLLKKAASIQDPEEKRRYHNAIISLNISLITHRRKIDKECYSGRKAEYTIKKLFTSYIDRIDPSKPTPLESQELRMEHEFIRKSMITYGPLIKDTLN